MSWSFSAIGKPEAVARALDTQNAGLTGQSKVEWDEAKPALKALVGANVGTVAVQVNASGHATFDNEGKKTSGTCSCNVGVIHGFVE